MTPYAYTLRSYSDRCFPTLENAVRYVILQGYAPHLCLGYSPIIAHYPDCTSDCASVEEYLEEIPVDLPLVEAEIDAAITVSRERYEQEYPTPEDKAYERSHRFSGCGWFHETDRAEMIQSKVNSLKWKWKDYLTSS